MSTPSSMVGDVQDRQRWHGKRDNVIPAVLGPGTK